MAAYQSSRKERYVSAAIFWALNLFTMLLAASSFTGAVWATPRFTFLRPKPITSIFSALMEQHFQFRRTRNATVSDEYEGGCERIRSGSFVRAPSNAFTSIAFLSAPVYQIATNKRLWAGEFRGVQGLMSGVGVVSIVLGTALTHSTFLYHSSATVQLNRFYVRIMMLFLLHHMLQCVYLSSRQILHKQRGGPAWRRELRTWGRPLFAEVTTLGLVIAFFIYNQLHDHFEMILMMMAVFMVLVAVISAGVCLVPCLPVEHASGGGGGMRVAGVARGGGGFQSQAMCQQMYLSLFVAGLVLKVLDDSKMLCGAWDRDSLLQLTAAMHALTGLGSMFGDMHTMALLHVDSEEERRQS